MNDKTLQWTFKSTFGLTIVLISRLLQWWWVYSVISNLQFFHTNFIGIVATDSVVLPSWVKIPWYAFELYIKYTTITLCIYNWQLSRRLEESVPNVHKFGQIWTNFTIPKWSFNLDQSTDLLIILHFRWFFNDFYTTTQSNIYSHEVDLEYCIGYISRPCIDQFYSELVGLWPTLFPASKFWL
jgi:hypothetical protein